MSATTVYWIKLGIIALIDVAAIYWIWKQVKKDERELEVSSIERQSVGDARTVTDSPPQKAKGPLLDITSPRVPPILNQSERWLGQERAREAEAEDDFWDAPTPPRAA